MPERDDRELVELLAAVWASTDAACSGLAEAQWKTATEVPGWSVQDNLAHISAIESTLLGRPAPDHELVGEFPHVKNDIGRMNEVWVDARRSWSGAQVLAEFREVTGERLAQLRALRPEDFDAPSWTPRGDGTVRDLLPFRVFDSWCHEQDIRRALDLPRDFTAPAAAFVVGRSVDSMPFVVGKRVQPADGTTVLFDLTGPAARAVAITVEGGRARAVDGAGAPGAPGEPAVTLRMSTETFHRLATGRLDPLVAVGERLVELAGDDALGLRILDAMNYLF